MSFRPTRNSCACALLMLGGAAALAQYSTPVGTGAAKAKTLRATAVLEWTGSLEKPSASRLMPIAVWDGEHYQPAGLYLAHPAPLAFETGTQYQLQRSGEPTGLFNVRAAGQVSGEWIGIGRFQPQAAPPPPPKLKPSKRLPVASGSKSEGSEKGGSDRPTLHTKPGDSAPASSDPKGPAGSAGAGTASDGKPASTSSDSDAPTLHRRTPSDDGSTSTPAATTPPATKSGSGTSAPAATPGAGSTTSTSDDSDHPTLHRRTDSADTNSAGTTASDTSKSPAADTDRPALHRPADTKASDPDADRPTLHRARPESAASASIDPDRPRLRYGRGAEGDDAVLPVRLVGRPPSMQQMVAVSDAATGEERPYQYHWPAPEDALKMQSAMAALAAQAVAAKPKSAATAAAAKTQFGPASHTTARRARSTAVNAGPPAPALVEEHFAAYELSFSGGATLVYTAHTAGEGAQRVYVTLIAQPDFSGKPQVLFQQVTRGDRLDETPAMQLVDALDTDNDQRAELIFQLNGALAAPAPSPADTPEAGAAEAQPADTGSSATAGSSAASRSAAAQANASAAVVQSARAATVPEREFAIYRVANGKAFQVFSTGPLP